MRSLTFIQISLFIVLCCGFATAEQTQQCSEFDIQVIAPDAELVDRTCAAALRAKSFLQGCHLVQSRPLVIRVRRDGPHSGLLAHFSLRNDEIVLPTPRFLVDILAKDSGYRAIPSEHLFNSFVVHEMAHAFFGRTRCGLETCRAGHEYIAYALQLESLPEEQRTLFLAEFPSRGNVEIGIFNDFYHDLMPERFAVDAWRHFSQPGFGCSFINDILLGQVTFPSEAE